MSNEVLRMRCANTDELNAMIDNNNFSRCKFTINPYAKEEYGKTYFKNYQRWAPDALKQLLELWATQPSQHKFVCGSFGSVFLDVDLTASGVTKKTRVTFMKVEEDGRFWIMLDATFDDTFEAPRTQ